MADIELLIEPRTADLGGGLRVRRLLPYIKRRMVGPFIFLDHMGPAEFAAGGGIDVRPHPHIGLSTVTYLYSGEIIHRDSLGSHQAITPGAVNWMTAGHGIAHSERTGAAERGHAHHLHGLQSWVALPREYEEADPGFLHYEKTVLPAVNRPGLDLTVIAGAAYGETSTVKTHSPLFYVTAILQSGATLEVPEHYAERALHVIDGQVAANGTAVPAGTMAVFENGAKIILEARSPTQLVILGGEPLPEQRYIWWNFVSSSKDRIEEAKADWKAGRFAKIPGDATEFIPLPE